MTKQTSGLSSQGWVQELLTRESFTSWDIYKLTGMYGPDGVTRLRNDRGLKLTVLGPASGGHPRSRLYRLEKVEGEA